MNPSAAVIFIVFAFVAGIGATLLFQSIKAKLDLSVFSAYSDEELEAERKATAFTVRYRVNYGHKNVVAEPKRLLKRIDREIARRKSRSDVRMETLTIEAKKAEFQKDIAEYDLVYEEVLNSVRKPQRGR